MAASHRWREIPTFCPMSRANLVEAEPSRTPAASAVPVRFRCARRAAEDAADGRRTAAGSWQLAADRATALSWGQEPDHHGRWGRLERRAGAAVEVGVAAAG